MGAEQEWLRKSNVDWVNLIKVHYIHAVNVKMKHLLCTMHLC
jgi:hypothetical protein